VATVPEASPPAGAVHDTVALFEHHTGCTREVLFPREESCYMSAEDSPNINKHENSLKSTSTKRFNVVPSNLLKATKSTQTSLATPVLSHSTPITSHHHPPPPSYSPMFCSPLLSSHPNPRPVSGLLKLNSLDQASLDSIRYVQPINSTSIDNHGVDFSNPVGRQTAFTTALGQASQDTTSSGHFDTCVEISQEVADEKNVVKEKVKPRSPQVVTFNSSVEEITTSIVSLETDSQAVSSSSSQGTVRITGSGADTVDFYCDDELHPSLQLDPNNMQLLSTQVNKDWGEEEEQYNTADLETGLAENDSTSSDYCEVGSKIKEVAIDRQESSSNSNIEEDNDIEDSKYQSAVESTVREGGDLNGENCTGDGRKELKNVMKRQSKLVQDKQDENDEGIKKKYDNPRNGLFEGDITGEVEISVVYEEASITVDNDLNGFEEDLKEDESDEKNVEVDVGGLGETVYEEANSSVVNVPYDYEEGWNHDGINQENNEETGEGNLGGTDAYEEANSLENVEVVEEGDINETSAYVEGDRLSDSDSNGENEDNYENDWNEGGSSGNDDDEEPLGGEMAEWKEGDECVARWDEDECWYKAVVERVEGDTIVVIFTEFGNSASCTREYVKDPSTVIGEDGQLVVEDDYEDEWG